MVFPRSCGEQCSLDSLDQSRRLVTWCEVDALAPLPRDDDSYCEAREREVEESGVRSCRLRHSVPRGRTHGGACLGVVEFGVRSVSDLVGDGTVSHPKRLRVTLQSGRRHRGTS